MNDESEYLCSECFQGIGNFAQWKKGLMISSAIEHTEHIHCRKCNRQHGTKVLMHTGGPGWTINCRLFKIADIEVLIGKDRDLLDV